MLVRQAAVLSRFRRMLHTTASIIRLANRGSLPVSLPHYHRSVTETAFVSYLVAFNYEVLQFQAVRARRVCSADR